MFVVTALAVIILSYDTSDTATPTGERTPLTSPAPSHTRRTFALTLTLFMTVSVILCGLTALATQTYVIIAVETVLGCLAFLTLLFIWVRFKLKSEERQLSFRSPAKPLVQGFSILLNLLLLFHLEVRALLQLALYALLGVVIYFAYGIWNSKLTKQKKAAGESTELGPDKSGNVIQKKKGDKAT